MGVFENLKHQALKSGFCVFGLFSTFCVVLTQSARGKRATGAVPEIKRRDERWRRAPYSPGGSESAYVTASIGSAALFGVSVIDNPYIARLVELHWSCHSFHLRCQRQ